MIIGIDVDGVLRDFVGSVQRIVKNLFPHMEIKEHTTYALQPAYPDDFDISKFIWEGSHTRDIFSAADIFPGAEDFMHKLSKLKVDVAICTSQKYRTEQYTLNWLQLRGIKYDHFFVTNAKHLLPVKVLVDDKPSTIINCQSSSKIIPICFEQPWNTQIESPIIRTNKYDKILDIIERIT